MHRTRGSRLLLSLVAPALAALTLGACGSSGGNAQDLLNQTFGRSHQYSSANVTGSLTIGLHGSSTVQAPVTVNFSGPFQTVAKGKLPKFDLSFNLAGSAAGGALSAGAISTGDSGFVKFNGTSYPIPASFWGRFKTAYENAMAQLTQKKSNGGSGNNFLQVLKHPAVLGNENVAGADTTHIQAGMDTSGVKPPTGSSAQVVKGIQNGRIDVWTGKDDKTLRKLAMQFTIQPSGSTSSAAGGFSSADINVTVQLGQLNQPQSIPPPANTKPIKELVTQLRGLFSALSGSAAGTGSAGTGATGTGQAPTPSTGAPAGYAQCISAAGNDIVKMQQCASLLNKK
jgi:hypothetical protein